MIAGLILAGGDGQRLGGVRKADLRLANVPLAKWSVSRLSGQADAVLLSVAEDARANTGMDIITLPDLPDGVTGPAAGLSAGALWCAGHGGYGLMISMSVDTPFFPADFVERAKPLLSPDIGCVVGCFGGRDFPTNALWHVPALRNALANERRAAKGPRLRDLAARIGVARCDYGDLPENPFAGINTLPDLLALSAGLRGGAQTA